MGREMIVVRVDKINSLYADVNKAQKATYNVTGTMSTASKWVMGIGGALMIMAAVLTEKLIYEILAVVEELPEGKVSTYGRIAELIGREKNSRMVGKVLAMSDYYGRYPCHRVVNHAGRTAPGFLQQRDLLEKEGVTFLPNGNVDLKRHLWNGE